MTLNDLEPQKWAFWRMFLQFLAAAHILKVHCSEVAGDRPKQPAYEIFTIKRGFL